MAMKEHWIAKAIGKNKGKFGRKAANAGMSTGAYASKEKNASGTLGREARMAQTLARIRPK